MMSTTCYKWQDIHPPVLIPHYSSQQTHRVHSRLTGWNLPYQSLTNGTGFTLNWMSLLLLEVEYFYRSPYPSLIFLYLQEYDRVIQDIILTNITAFVSPIELHIISEIAGLFWEIDNFTQFFDYVNMLQVH